MISTLISICCDIFFRWCSKTPKSIASQSLVLSYLSGFSFSFMLPLKAISLSWLTLLLLNKSLNHSWSNSYLVLSLFFASFCKQSSTNFLQLALTCTDSSNLWFRRVTAFVIPGIPIPSTFVGKKGGLLYSIMKVSTPRDQTSHFSL